MAGAFEKFLQNLAQDAVRHTGEFLIDICHEQVPLLKPALGELRKGMYRYPPGKEELLEKTVRDRLAAQFPQSQTEVVTPTGKIDILTPFRVIEVKNVRFYKHAIGQVISYGHYYPHHDRWIYLFGAVAPRQKKAIQRECATAQVKLGFVL